MLKFQLSILLSCVIISIPYPNVFEMQKCNLTINGTNFTFERSFVEENYNGEIIYFSACKDLLQVGCDKDAFACIKKDNRFINFVDILQENFDSLIVQSRDSCVPGKYEFEMHFSLKGDKYKLTKPNKCKYLLLINPHYEEYCTKTVNNRKLSFKELSKDISIKDNEDTIVFNLCGAAASCKDDTLAVCSRNPSGVIQPLGLISTQHVSDSGGEIVFHYKTMPRESEKLTIIYLKCNWTTALGPMTLRRKSKKKIEIRVETYLACAKRTRSCSFSDSDNYLYNLSNLTGVNGWYLARDNGSKTTKLNICGPLNSEKLCSDQQSQVCYSYHGQMRNYGSVMAPIIVENDAVKFSFKDGSQCPKNASISLAANFELRCSFKEEGPKLIKENDCSLDIIWKTPSACPLGDDAGRYKTNDEYDRKSCVVEDDDLKYDLQQLSMNTRNHVVKNNELDFLLNVCRPVVGTDNSFCQSSTGICLRNNSEPNIKKRFFSIGGVQNPKVENRRLVLRYTLGSLCKRHMKDSSAVIYFDCADKEGEPTFLKEDRCVYEFNWKTKHACPNKIECILRDNLDNIINLENVKATNFQFKTDNATYDIDICKDQFLVASKGQKKHVKVRKSVYNDNRRTLIEYQLDKNCADARDFNIIKIHLVCDVLLNNEHYEFDNISFCVAYLNLKHNNFCQPGVNDFKTGPNHLNVTPNGIEKKVLQHNYYEVIGEKDDDIKNCSFLYKDWEINLNTFKPIRIISPNKKWYTIGINKTSCCCHQFICSDNKPLATLNKCPKVQLQNDELKVVFNDTSSGLSRRSEITFYCKTKEALPQVTFEGTHLVSFQYPLDDLCDEGSGGSGSLIAGIVSCVFIIFLCFLLAYNREFFVRNCRQRRKSNTYVYCKNSED